MWTALTPNVPPADLAARANSPWILWSRTSVARGAGEVGGTWARQDVERERKETKRTVRKIDFVNVSSASGKSCFPF